MCKYFKIILDYVIKEDDIMESLGWGLFVLNSQEKTLWEYSIWANTRRKNRSLPLREKKGSGQAENSKHVGPKIAKFSGYSRNKIVPPLWLEVSEGGGQ